MLVVDGNPTEDERFARLRGGLRHVRWLRSAPGRGPQMNAGARCAKGRWLLFLQADTRLDQHWLEAIRQADRDAGVVGGSFRLLPGATSGTVGFVGASRTTC
jgi:hypothetical protein